MTARAMFGAMLDRDAGTFRLGPADTMVPAARPLPAGHDDPGDHVGHRPRLADRPRPAARSAPGTTTDERSRTHRRAPTDHDADHVLLRTMRCVNGSVEVKLDCEPIFDYGRRYAHWAYAGEGYDEAVATVRGLGHEAAPDDRPARSASRAPACAPSHHAEGDGETAFVSLAFSRPSAARRPTTRAYERLVKTADFWHQWLAHGKFPDHPWRHVPAAQRPDAEGPDLLADRRDDRRGHHDASRRPRAASATGTTATAGSATRTFMLWGAALARLRLGGERLLLLHRRTPAAGGPTCRSCTASAASAT